MSGKGLLLWVGMGLMTSQNVLQPKILFRTQETQALTTHGFQAFLAPIVTLTLDSQTFVHVSLDACNRLSITA